MEHTHQLIQDKAMSTAETETKAVSKAKGRPNAARVAANELREAQQVGILFKQASDPTRLRILRMLAEGERNVGQICDRIISTQPAVSHHLALMRHGSLIAPRRAGKNNYYSLTDKGVILAQAVERLTMESAKVR